MIFISISYFLILISTEQKSLPFLTNKIESRIDSYLDKNDKIQINNIQIKRNNFNIIAHLNDVQLSHSNLFIEIPKVKLTFSIFNLILLQSTINKIEIADLNIKYHSYLQKNNNFNLKINNIISNFLESDIRKVKIDNVNINLIKNNNPNKTILIKDFDLKINKQKSNFLANIILDKQNIKLQKKCYLEDDDSICDIILSKIDNKFIANLHPKLSDLATIEGQIASNFTLKSNSDNNIISFMLQSANGAINNDHIFQDKVSFSDLKLFGDYYINDQLLKNVNFDLNFDNDIKFLGDINFKNPNKYNINLSLNNLTRKDLSKLWPVLIPGDDNIKKWVLRHIKSFQINKSNISMQFDQNKLINIDANFDFDNAAILYDKYFPTIYNISGKAHFDNNSMKITANNGSLLQSKIKSATITIPDFFQEIPSLQIRGNIAGRAEDLLKHVNYQSDFAKNIGNYINGYANSYIDLVIFLNDQIKLQDTYLQIHSKIKNLNNNYVEEKSNMNIDITKKANSNIFTNQIDLTKSDINFKPLSIKKDKNIISKLSFNIIPKNNSLIFNDINLLILNDNLLKGDLSFNIKDSQINKLNLIHPDFKLFYEVSNKASIQKLSIKGKKLDLNKLQSILKSNDQNNQNNFKYRLNDLEIIIDDLILANDVTLNDVDININCNYALCINSFIHAKQNGKEIINIDFKPYPLKKITQINGKIHNIAPLARGFGIYDKILEGDLIIKSQMKVKDDNVIIFGKSYNKKDYKIAKDDIQIAQDSFFAKIRDQLDSEDIMIFQDLDSNFNIKNGVLEIEKFIISNNYLGVTAKGNIGIIDGKIDINGLFIPGYLINRLFGIGDLPIIKHIISPILVGEDGGGIFAGKYQLQKIPSIDNKLRFNLNKGSIFAPGAIRNFFD
ncbi:DUF3971 domain-containing protein [Rickettsiales bacterium]|nr:DUF3971 domain-containing protein [Rickettsiales bacterium]